MYGIRMADDGMFSLSVPYPTPDTSEISQIWREISRSAGQITITGGRNRFVFFNRMIPNRISFCPLDSLM